MNVKELTIDYQPHAGQKLFHECNARFKLLVTGRRWGKTITGANETIKECIENPGSIWFVVAPIFPQTMKCKRTIKQFLPYELIRKEMRTENYIELINKSIIWFKSADKPDSLRSEGLHGAWVDECAMVKKESWQAALRAALMDQQGKFLGTTTPKGHNWVMDMFTRGQDDKEKDFASWNYPSSNNPYLPQSEIDEMKRTMPQKVYEQEVMGLFIDDVGSIFRGVDACIMGKLEGPLEDHEYFIGVDLAKHVDFTVIIVMDKARRVVFYDRFNKLDWTFQKRMIRNVAVKYNDAQVLIDSTGIGDPIFDDLRKSGMNVQGYKYTHASKLDLINNLAVHINERTVSYPNIPVLINELKIFGYVKEEGKDLKYDAPQGYHDDCVNALALAVMCVDQGDQSGGVEFLSW